MGYHPQDFDFKPRETPMSTLKESSLMILTYYIVIFGGREIMRNRSAIKMNGIFMLHNFYLTAISGILLCLFVEQLVPTVVNKGIFYAICDVEGGWTPPLVILYYVCFPDVEEKQTNAKQLNYLTKYLELLDTVFLVLKKKPLSEYWVRINPRKPLTFCSLPPLLPPRRDSSSLLYTIDWFDFSIMGSHYTELDGPRCDVLVLFPECARHPHLVEGMDHSSPDHPVCH